jgi:hypothetical protein
MGVKVSLGGRSVTVSVESEANVSVMGTGVGVERGVIVTQDINNNMPRRAKFNRFIELSL